MSRVYLIRHGQAGTRGDYDSLSPLGHRQARLLGEYFAAEGMSFVAAFSGTLARQRQTAEAVRTGYEAVGIPFPDITPDCGWNEFDLADVYRAFAPLLCAEDPQFRAEYEEMARQARAAAERPEADVHRRWLPCDVKIVEAWFEGRHAYEGESWKQFRERVAACRARLPDARRDDAIAVFTSATPIGVWAGMTLDICDRRVMRLAGALHNTSCTVIRVHQDQVRLHSFNTIPHLREPELRTYR